MQKLILIVTSFMMLFLIACNESTVNPIPNSQNINTDYLTIHVWKLENTSFSGGVIKSTKFKFEKDSTFSSLIENTWFKGTWSLAIQSNPGDSSIVDTVLKLNYGPNAPYLNTYYQVRKLNAESLKIEMYSNTKLMYEYIPETKISNEVSITGDIIYDVSMSDLSEKDLTNAKVCIIWVQPDNDESTVVYGIGNLNKDNLTFNLKVDDSYPMSLFISNSYGVNGYFNVGYVVLLWGDDIKNGKVLKNTDLTGRKVGMVASRGFVYVGGDYQKWNVNQTMLQGEIKQGFNYCEGWYSNQQGVYDGWIPTPLKQKQIIKVVPSWKNDSFVFPNWT